MADPHYAFHFRINWDETHFLCSKINGLNTKVQATDYREDMSLDINKVNMPGLIEYGNIVLKHCMFTNDNEFFIWFNSVKNHKFKPHDMIVKLLNEERKEVITWKIQKAWPAKVPSFSMNTDNNENIIETLEVAHEGFALL